METLREKQRRSIMASRIQDIRKAKGLNQFDLANLMDCSQGLISQYEANTAKISLNTTTDIADALGCSVDYLIGRDAQYDTSLRGRIYKAFEGLSADRQNMVVVMLEAAAEEKI